MIPEAWERKIRGWIRSASLGWDLIAVPGDGGAYELEGRDDEGHVWQDPAVLVQHYGVRSRPGPRAEAFAGVGRGGTSQRLIIATRSLGDIPRDDLGQVIELADWEVDFYSRYKQRIYLRADGALLFTTDAAPISATTKSGASVTIPGDGQNVDVRATHLLGAGDIPTIAPDPTGLGAAGSATMLGGNDSSFRFEVTTDPANAPGAGPIAKVTFSKPWSSVPPAPIITGAKDIASAGAQPFPISWGLNDLTIGVGIASPDWQTNTTYTFVCRVG